ncbi:MAG: carboxypeptidase regulatory-like domain-containing protein [Planctomycetes bacterium]|nr:carboxypeptidase regulatory-like domain-containing protein [Planctomycetota bacterium]
MQRLVLFLLALVVLGALAVFFLLPARDPVAPARSSESSSPRADAIEPPASLPEAAVDDTQRSASAEPAVAPVAPVPPEEPGLDVLVVERETGRPIAGAEVCGLTDGERVEAQDPRARFLRLGPPDLFTLAAAARRNARTDADGRARLSFAAETSARAPGRSEDGARRGAAGDASSSGANGELAPDAAEHAALARAAAEARVRAFSRVGVTLAARAPGRYGLASRPARTGGFGRPPPPPSNEPVRIELALDRALVVRAVDATGAGVAGVPVAIAPRDGGVNSYARRRAITGADGAARFEHLQPLLDELGAGRELGAQLEIVARAKPNAAVPAGAHEVVIVLPPCGSLVVRTLDTRGAELDAQSVHARALPADGNKELPEGASFTHVAEAAPEVAPGHARFPFVEVGLALQVRGESALHEPQRAECAGPAVAGAEAELDLVFSTPSVALVGRCVDETGAPVAKARVSTDGSWRPNVGGSFTFHTDADGRFRVPLRGESPMQTRLRLRLRVVGAVGHPHREGGVERELQLERGDNDLGEIVLARPPLLASGVVRDEQGASIAGVRVWASWVDRPRERNVTNPLRMVHTDDAGRFELEAACDELDVELHAAEEGFTPVSNLRVAVGTRGLELVLRRAPNPDAPAGGR